MRLYLAFFVCCCKSFLGPDTDETTTGEDGEKAKTTSTSTNYYSLLQIPRDASPDEIKRAYKKQSLLMHPDKLTQRGITVTASDQAKFTNLKEAYEVLSDPHKRETYDAIGARGMKWLEEPFSIDPQELAHNFAKSSILDRSKIFAIFVSIAVTLLIQPILICMHIDGDFGQHASWIATFTPLWIWNVLLISYHTNMILMGPIQKPDHIPDNEWVDPLPMHKRIFSFVRFLLIVLFEVLVSFKLDHIIKAQWFVVFIPLYVWELTTLYKKLPLARMRIVTVEDLEAALGKPFSEFTPAEKELIGQRYSVVSSTSSPDFDIAQKLKTRARHDIVKSLFRVGFVILLLVQLDGNMNWNWWVVFLPFWIVTTLICYANYQSFAEVQKMAAEKDPTLFGQTATSTPLRPKPTASTSAGAGDVETGNAVGGGGGNVPSSSYYGAVGDDGYVGKMDNSGVGIDPAAATFSGGAAAPAASTTPPVPELSDEEREELKAQVMASSSRLCSKCCFQGFILIIFIFFVGKLQGAPYSAFLIISPFLLIAGLILCCLGCAIFGVTEVSTDGIDFENTDFDYANAEQQGTGLSPPNSASATAGLGQPSAYTAPSTSQPIYIPPPPQPESTPTHADMETTGTTTSAVASEPQRQPQQETSAGVGPPRSSSSISNVGQTSAEATMESGSANLTENDKNRSIDLLDGDRENNQNDPSQIDHPDDEIPRFGVNDLD